MSLSSMHTFHYTLSKKGEDRKTGIMAALSWGKYYVKQVTSPKRSEGGIRLV